MVRKGREKKYSSRVETNVSFCIPEHFRTKYKFFKKIVAANINNKNFRNYCEKQENCGPEKSLSSDGKGVVSMYIRWMMSQEIFRNKDLINKLSEKKDG